MTLLDPCCRVPLRNRAGDVIAEAIVDDADFASVSAHRWYPPGPKGYAVRHVRLPGGVRRAVYLHRELLGLVPGDGLQGDHRNGNRLDNRRSNLRVTDSHGNNSNLHGPMQTVGRTSIYRGVCWHKRARRWTAQAQLRGCKHWLGYFDDEQEAAAVASAFRRQHMPTSDMDQEAA